MLKLLNSGFMSLLKYPINNSKRGVHGISRFCIFSDDLIKQKCY